VGANYRNGNQVDVKKDDVIFGTFCLHGLNEEPSHGVCTTVEHKSVEKDKQGLSRLQFTCTTSISTVRTVVCGG
jgi:hypothetical protein